MNYKLQTSRICVLFCKFNVASGFILYIFAVILVFTLFYNLCNHRRQTLTEALLLFRVRAVIHIHTVAHILHLRAAQHSCTY